MSHSLGAPRRAFTLIELLVVVAIIGLLVSILIPSLKAARDSAKQVVCLTHMKAQYDAASAYADDNTDIFLAGIIDTQPPSWLGDPGLASVEIGLAHQFWLPYLGYQIPMDKVTNTANLEFFKAANLFGNKNANAYRNQEVWQGRMGAAFGSMEVYQCPSYPEVVFDNKVVEPELDYIANAMPSPFPGTAAQVGDIVRDPGQAEIFVGVAVGSVNYFNKRTRGSIGRPADLMYIGESDEALVRFDIAGGGGLGGTKTGRLSFIQNAIFTGSHLPNSKESRIDNDFDDGEIRKRHPGGSNLMFFDGHGETMSYTKQDPGHLNAPLAIRLRYFADPSKLPAQYQ